MAIVHVVFKSSSHSPPASAHAAYIAREGQYAQRGGVELVEHGNLPEFAQSDPFMFWAAADAQERANGRTYTEIQLALPRELGRAEREELAREAARELLGDRFAYTMAIHAPVGRDQIEQPHLHLMFSERAVTKQTRGIEEERFFKRNGAKKDPEWNRRDKPDEVREKWVEMMNRAMERAGQEQRLDARSWAEQGREDLAALVEPKLLGGDGLEAQERREQVDALRRQREELPAPHLSQAAAVERIEREAEKRIAEVERRRDEQISLLDQLIEKARELAVEVKDRAVAAARQVGAFLGVSKEEEAAKDAPVREKVRAQEQASPPGPSLSPSMEAQLDQKLRELDRRLAARESIENKLAELDRRMDAAEAAKEKQEKQQQRELQQQQIERRPRGFRNRDFGIER